MDHKIRIVYFHPDLADGMVQLEAAREGCEELFLRAKKVLPVYVYRHGLFFYRVSPAADRRLFHRP